jgi:pSer/pThr/pTyr-binding forkhead associated (FHA) protein
MATLTRNLDNDVKEEWSIGPGEHLTIGRRDDNDVVLESPVISGMHAKIDHINERYLLTDLQTKNGTYVNGRPIATHWLRDGDVVTIGPEKLLFSLSLLEAVSLEDDAEDEDTDQTTVLDPGAIGLAPRRELTGVLTYLKGGQGEVKLTKKLVKLGKDPASDVVLSGMTVGKTAATISRRPDGYSLDVVGGMAKPKVNGRAVTASVTLKEYDEIQIGSTRLKFILK